MKTSILLFLVVFVMGFCLTPVFVGCTQKPKISAGEIVKVKGGFYKGCTGTVTDFTFSGGDCGFPGQIRYTVSWVDCGTFTSGIVNICAKDVE